MTWTVSRSRHVLRDRWISVRADDCRTPAGVEIAPYYVLEYPDFVHALAIDRDGMVILVEQYRHGLGGLSLELPGGLKDDADRDVIATAERELREETGYAGGRAELTATLSDDPAKMANRTHLVTIRDVELRHPTAFDEGEDIRVIRVPAATALDRAASGAIVHAAHVGMLWLGLRRLGLAGA